ncbi:MAG: ribonuclease E/G [Rhodospirillaceae bacterium]|nr:ribonuclease E/G [Rhodospirillaceae bacterium]
MIEVAGDSVDGLALAAVLKDGVVWDLRAADPAAPLVEGAVHWCRVTRSDPRGGGWGAIGDIPVRLAGGDARAALTGGPLLVQVTALTRPAKLAEVSTDIALPGRCLVHRPFGRGIHGAKRLPGFLAADWAARLPAAGGWIVRRRAATATPDTIDGDAQRLAELGRRLTAAAPSDSPAPVLPGLDPLRRLILDCEEPAAVRMASPDAARPLSAWCRHWAPEVADVVQVTPVDLSEPFVAAQSPDVALACGARLLIEPTAALVAVDVDLAAAASDRTANLDACRVLPREIRLRNLAGAVVVDLIGGAKAEADTKALAAAVADGFADDPATVQVIGIDRLGLLRLARQRRGAALADVLAGRR